MKGLTLSDAQKSSIIKRKSRGLLGELYQAQVDRKDLILTTRLEQQEPVLRNAKEAWTKVCDQALGAHPESEEIEFFVSTLYPEAVRSVRLLDKWKEKGFEPADYIEQLSKHAIHPFRDLKGVVAVAIKRKRDLEAQK